jgi:hypothetical protein
LPTLHIVNSEAEEEVKKSNRRRRSQEVKHTIVSYNASVVKSYNATSSRVVLKICKDIFHALIKALAGVVVVNSEPVGLAPGLTWSGICFALPATKKDPLRLKINL